MSMMKKGKMEVDTYIPSYNKGYTRKKYKKYMKKNYGNYSHTIVGHPETKYFDTGFSGNLAAVTTTWAASLATDPATFNTLCVPSLGNDINNRIGRRIGIKKIKIRGDIELPATAGTIVQQPAIKCRAILVIDTQTNGAQMTGSNLMSGGANAGICINSYQNLISLGRFKVLKDKLFDLSDPNFTSGLQNGIHKFFKINHVFTKPLTVNFNATNGGTIADIVDNSIHFLVQCDNTTVGTPNLQYAARVSYVDL